MNFYNHLKDISKNDHYLDRYVNFIKFCETHYCKYKYKEKHHVLPASLFPQFKKEIKNIVFNNRKFR